MKSEIRYATLSCVRNEEKNLDDLFNTILLQSIKPNHIVVANDGSTDNSTNIIDQHVDKINKSYNKSVVKALHLEDRGFSALGTFYMADPYNAGFKYLIAQDDWDYLVILAADTRIPSEYVETIISKMENEYGVASGLLEGRKPHPLHVPGTGRVIRRDLLEDLGGFPRTYCWESAIIFYSAYKGYKTNSLNNPTYFTNRSDNKGSGVSYKGWGRGMKDCGYHWSIVYGRILKSFFKLRWAQAIRMFWGYTSHKTKKQTEWMKFNRENQKLRIKQSFRRFGRGKK